MSENEYMEQVMANQQKVEVDLRAKRNVMASPARMAIAQQAQQLDGDDQRRARVMPLPEAPPSAPVEVKITGWWRWKTVIVPPNAHVVHTRRGHDKPLHVGLGVSFAFNPAKDSFLVVPGTMQTILINAHCICRELQGLLVQGYVQWIVADFATAYKKLDFSDVEDPMRVVNVQLREQAEAAIKDKVATMGIDEVLSDKQPIIEELTARLRSVAEGEGGTDKGLGLRIITVQIKEAVVSSRRVWENLQKPFRAERARVARLAELEAETAISARERIAERDRESAQLEADAEVAKLRSSKEAEAFDREQSEAQRRVQREQEVSRATAADRHQTALAAAALEKVRVAHEAEVAKVRAREAAEAKRLETEAAIAIAELRRIADNQQAEAELRFLSERERIANGTSAENLRARLIAALPELAAKLPKPDELRAITIGDGAGAHQGQALSSLIAQVLALVDGVRAPRETS